MCNLKEARQTAQKRLDEAAKATQSECARILGMTDQEYAEALEHEIRRGTIRKRVH